MNVAATTKKSQGLSLLKYETLDSRFEEVLKDFALLASLICQAPNALISFMDESRCWYKAGVGFQSEHSRASFYKHTILQTGLLQIENAAADPRFAEHPLFIENPGIRFYVSVPLVAREWHTVGSLCIWDELPRVLSESQKQALLTLTRRITQQLEQRRKESELLSLQTLTLGEDDKDDFETSLRKTLQHLCQYSGWVLGQAWLPQPEGKSLACGPYWLESQRPVLKDFQKASQGTVLNFDRDLPGRAWSAKAPFWTSELALLSPGRSVAARTCGLKAGAAFPVLSGEEVVAVLEFFQVASEGKDEHLLRSVATVVAQLGSVIQRNHLEAELRQAQKMDAIGKLAGGVAHDFNNLLTVILGHSENLLSKLADKNPLFRPIAEIKKAGERGAALTRQLLAFSRKQVLQPKIIDLNSLVEGMERMLRRLIGEDIQLITRRGAGLGLVKADPGQLEQVLMNLVVNARDAMPKGGRLILETKAIQVHPGFVRKNPGSRTGRYVCLSIKDTGMGMDAKVKARLFEPFFTTKEPGKGSGLGLSTVYGIVRQSGGFLKVESTPRQGSTFHIYLPRVKQLRVVAGALKVPRKIKAGSETVLYVEDDEIVRNLGCEMLKSSGYKVLAAQGGDEALKIFARQHSSIDLVVSDVVMPGMNGRELVKRLRARKQGLRVLYLSGHTDQTLVGVDRITSFLQKPFSQTTLSAKIQELLKKRS